MGAITEEEQEGLKGLEEQDGSDSSSGPGSSSAQDTQDGPELPIRNQFLQTFATQFAAALVGVLGMVVDGAVTGSFLSVDHMSAYGIAMPIMTVFLAVATVFEVGASALVGRMLGSGNAKDSGKALWSCLTVAVGVSLVLMVIALVARDPLATLLGAQPGTMIHDEAANFILGISFMAPALSATMMFFNVLQLNGDGKRLVAAVVAMTVLDIILDLLNGCVIHGGLLGMALATTISYYVAFGIVLTHFFRKDIKVRLIRSTISAEHTLDMFRLGLPSALQQICASLIVLFLNNLLMNLGGTDAVAINTAVKSASNLCMVIGTALGSTALIVGSVACGKNDHEALKELMRYCLRAALWMNVVLALVMGIFAPQIMPLFLKSGDASTLDTLVWAFRIYVPSVPFYALCCVLRFYCIARNMAALSYAFSICENFLFQALSALAFSAVLGLDGVWLSYFACEVLAFIAYGLYAFARTRGKGAFYDRFLMLGANESLKLEDA